MGSAYENVYGRHTVLAILENQPQIIAQINITNSKEKITTRIFNLARKHNIPLQTAQYDSLTSLASSEQHQGVVAKARKLEYKTLDDLLSLTNSREKSLILVLDQIQDPHNFGAIIRSAEAFGVVGIVVTQQHSAPLNAVVRKVASGAAELIPIAMANNIARALQEFKDDGFWVVGADMAGDAAIDKMRSNKQVLVVGAEGQGMRDLTKKNCDYLASIPLAGKTSSLNVSVATGVLLSKFMQ